ncbi:MAG: hypothetical protein QOF13_2040 [Solirubrobacterales bacterium]|nr:hypothetical protein [Solirubrobacterales bacterium]
MAADRGLDFGTQIVFSFGPLGFLDFPGAFVIDLGRLAFAWSALVHLSFCVALLWASRRAFGLLVGLAITLFAAAMPSSDPILLAAAVLAAAALLDEWSSRLRLAFALGSGALAGMQLLGSLRAGPVLVVMALAVVLGLPGRRRTLPAFTASLVVSFLVFWLATGQGLGNLDDYALNTASVLSGYSSSMVYVLPGSWWQFPAFVVGTSTLAALAVAAGWRWDAPRRIGLLVMVAAVAFLMFKHSVVRSSPGSAGVCLAALLAIGLALAPHVRRSLAVGAIAVLTGLAYIGNQEGFSPVTFDFKARAESFITQLKYMAKPSGLAEQQLAGREAMQAYYALTPRQLALLRSGTVHVATLEAGVAYAYGLDWDPLPVFQQYTAYTERLDELNAAKLESSSAPDRILWENAPAVDPTFVSVRPYPGTIDERVPAWDSPAEIVQMLCRYRVEDWDDRWAVLRHSPDRCGSERPLRSVTVAAGERVTLPATKHDEALLVRVDGLGVSGLERLRAFLFRAARRHAILDRHTWNVIPGTAGDGLLLRIPAWADYPGHYALDSDTTAIGFEAEDASLTFGPSDLTLHFSALPLDAPAILPVAGAQKRRVQRSIR